MHAVQVFTAEPQSLWQKVLPTGRTLGRTSSTVLLAPRKLAVGIFSRAAVLRGVAEHVREAGEAMTNGRTLLGRFRREHWHAAQVFQGCTEQFRASSNRQGLAQLMSGFFNRFHAALLMWRNDEAAASVRASAWCGRWSFGRWEKNYVAGSAAALSIPGDGLFVEMVFGPP